MSGGQHATRPKVPQGNTKYLITRQKEIKEGAFHVGYETIWESWQTEAEYTTPKRP